MTPAQYFLQKIHLVENECVLEPGRWKQTFNFPRKDTIDLLQKILKGRELLIEDIIPNTAQATATFIQHMYNKYHRYQYASFHEIVHKALDFYGSFPSSKVRASDFAYENQHAALNLPNVIQSSGLPAWGSLRYPWLVTLPTVSIWAYPFILLQFIFQYVRK